MNRSLLAAAVLVFLAHPVCLAAQAAPVALRDPDLPYSSWAEAARETAEAIGDRPLRRPADGRFVVGDAVIFNDDGKRYRAHVLGIEDGRYVVHYDGFGPDWRRRVGADVLLGYQPGYAPAVRAAAAVPRFEVGHELEAESNGKWYEARVIGVRDGRYRVHYDGQPSSADDWVAASRLRYLAGGPARTTPLAPGKYGCTATRYVAGEYRYDAKGSVVLFADGRYQYLGFAQPSAGRHRTDAASAVVSFSGGYLAGGEATPMVRRPGRFYLTAPGIGERGTCTVAN